MDDGYDSNKIYPPLDLLIHYLSFTPLMIEPKAGISSDQVMTEIKNLGGKIKNISFGGVLRVELPLKAVYKLLKLENIEKIRFDGDYNLLKGYLLKEGERDKLEWIQKATSDEEYNFLLYKSSNEKDKLDKSLIEVLFFLKVTSIIVKTIDRLNENDRSLIENLGGKITSDLYIINSYSAELPLEKIQELTKSPRIVNIWYDQPVGSI